MGQKEKSVVKTRTKKRSVKQIERMHQAWTLYQEGFTYRDIAQKLNYSKSQVQRDVEDELEEWMAEQRKEANKIKIREYLKLQRLDNKAAMAFNAVGTDAEKQEKVLKEIDARTKISSLIFKLFGLDKIVIEKSDKQNYDLSSFTDAELHRIAQGEEPQKILAERNVNITN
ncbi:MAG: helix-turn-helix domain-containing protein [Ignavibacteria bacterium]|nr:helix-turn-helix domain-containing protein [Ignavibacteria bacterium]